MKTIKLFFIALIAFSTLTTTFVGCKKGDGDPFLSLRSRKARVAGKWKLASGTVTDKDGTTVTKTYDGTNVTKTQSSGNSTSTKPYTEQAEFKKDGTFTSTVTDDGEVTTATGVWDFTDGVGEQKKKEQIVLTVRSTTDSKGTTITSTGWANPEIFDIYELKNKEMIWKTSSTETLNVTGVAVVLSSTTEKKYVQ